MWLGSNVKIGANRGANTDSAAARGHSPTLLPLPRVIASSVCARSVSTAWSDVPVGYRDTLAEAVELLASHIVSDACATWRNRSSNYRRSVEVHRCKRATSISRFFPCRFMSGMDT